MNNTQKKVISHILLVFVENDMGENLPAQERCMNSVKGAKS